MILSQNQCTVYTVCRTNAFDKNKLRCLVMALDASYPFEARIELNKTWLLFWIKLNNSVVVFIFSFVFHATDLINYIIIRTNNCHSMCIHQLSGWHELKILCTATIVFSLFHRWTNYLIVCPILLVKYMETQEKNISWYASKSTLITLNFLFLFSSSPISIEIL